MEHKFENRVQKGAYTTLALSEKEKALCQKNGFAYFAVQDGTISEVAYILDFETKVELLNWVQKKRALAAEIWKGMQINFNILGIEKVSKGFL